MAVRERVHVTSLGILTIATNQYIEFFRDLIRSFHVSDSHGVKVNFHVFTDDLATAKSIRESFPNVNIKVYPIKSYGWPEATLYRYRTYLEYFQSFEENFLMHLDADMLFIGDAIGKCLECLESDKMTLVSHPGFYRPKGLRRTRFYIENPIIGLKDFVLKVKHGGRGSWETNKKSMAYVPKRFRRIYVCGGVWFGPKQEFGNLITECEDLLQADEGRAVMAKWHDESYLNKWSSRNKYRLIEPSMCFEPSYPQLKQIKGLIQAVDKQNHRRYNPKS
jgi:histo-blood group ABO system transferase